MSERRAGAESGGSVAVSVRTGAYRFPVEESARRVIAPAVRVAFAVLMVLALALGLMFPQTFGTLGFILAVVVFSSLNYFRLRVLPYPVVESGESAAPEGGSLRERAQESWPSFTLLVPLKNEGSVIHPTLDALQALQYPVEKVQVLIIVEKGDSLTATSLAQYALPEHFTIVWIPSEHPATKGRALQYALPLASGKYLSIFDAESRPEPFQLMKAAELLEREGELACAQAVIKIENKGSNLITAFFAAEYIEWFYKHQARTVELGMPIGLAGNSFYIATQVLRQTGGWDMFNVTEDADLAVRLTRLGVRFHRLHSVTSEPCPDTFAAWIGQRVRWNKGLMITKLLHLGRNRLGLAAFPRDVWFHLWYRMLCGSLVPFAFVYTLIVGTYIAHFGSDTHLLLLNILMVGNLAFSLTTAILADGRNFKTMKLRMRPLRLLAGIFLYWTMFLLAGLRAYGEYLFAPLRWYKTDHDSLVHSTARTVEQAKSAARTVSAIS